MGIFINNTSQKLEDICFEADSKLEYLSEAINIVYGAISTGALQGNTKEIVLEDVNKTIFQKIKDAIVAFIKKIKDFFNNILDSLERYCMGSEDFIKKYKDIIKNKNTKGFKYSTYNFNNLPAQKLVTIDIFLKRFSEGDTNVDYELVKCIRSLADHGESSEEHILDPRIFKKAFCKAFNCDTFEEVKAKVRNEISDFNGKKEYEDFNGQLSKLDMLDLVSDFPIFKQILKELCALQQKKCDKLLARISGIDTKATNSNNSYNIKSQISIIISAVLSTYTSISVLSKDVVGIYKIRCDECLRILKAYVSFKEEK